MIRIQSRSSMAGFSLIELMIAIVAGLIVIGAVLAFTVSTIRAYSDNIRSTRLTQDLRTSMNVVVRELRRAGFDSTSVSRVLSDSNPSNFNSLVVIGTGNSRCVSYQYDRGVGGWGGAPAATERRAIRLNAGVIQVNPTDATAACGGGGWVNVSDPAIVQITKFTPEIKYSPFCADFSNRVDPATGNIVYQKATGSVRNISLCMQGRLRLDNSVVRHVANTTRVRAEDVQFFNNAATPCPIAIEMPDALPTTSAQNNTCATP